MLGKNVFPYLLPLLLLLQPVMSCTNNIAQQENENGNAEQDTSFRPFWALFKQAVKEKDISQLAAMTYFPLGGGRACFIERLHAQADYNNDSIGIQQTEFERLFNVIFDDETEEITRTPVDSVPLLQNLYPDVHLKNLEDRIDKPTNLYAYMINYSIGNREGDKVFVFAKIHGQYKLAWVICDGVITR